MSTKAERRIEGSIWLGDVFYPMDSPPVLEGEATYIDVERTDDDEVALHATMPGDDHALVSVFMTCQQATFIAAALNAKALSGDL